MVEGMIVHWTYVTASLDALYNATYSCIHCSMPDFILDCTNFTEKCTKFKEAHISSDRKIYKLIIGKSTKRKIVNRAQDRNYDMPLCLNCIFWRQKYAIQNIRRCTVFHEEVWKFFLAYIYIYDPCLKNWIVKLIVAIK